MSIARAGVLALVLTLAACVLGACAGPSRSTRLTASDMSLVASEFATALAGSDFVRERTQDSPRMVIAMNRVENLTSDIIPRREQWAMMAMIRDHAQLVALGRERNMAFVIPREFLDEGLASGALEEGAATRRDPTHELAMTLRSAVRGTASQRAEVYLADLRLTSISAGELEWTRTYELKRVASGLSFD